MTNDFRVAVNGVFRGLELNVEERSEMNHLIPSGFFDGTKFEQNFQAMRNHFSSSRFVVNVVLQNVALLSVQIQVLERSLKRLRFVILNVEELD